MGFSSMLANTGDKNFPNDKENKNSPTLAFINGVTSGALINRFVRNECWGLKDKKLTILNPEIALAEAVCATASAIVDAKPSTANTVIGWGNIVWGGIKLLIYFTSDPIGSSVTQAFYLTSIAANGVNAVYRLWYVKKTIDSGKK